MKREPTTNSQIPAWAGERALLAAKTNFLHDKWVRRGRESGIETLKAERRE